jgi:DNA-3-methyladenine glycosylase II
MAIDYSRARRVLARRDPVLAGIIKQYGACGLGGDQHTDPFRALIRAIVSQQLSTKAAATIAARFEGLYEAFPSPAMVRQTSDERLRAVGLSGQKVSYLRDLCRRIEDGSLPLASLDAMADEDVVTALTEVKGIGRWTAEMFLMFSLGRPDVFPVDDLGIRKAMQRAYGYKREPAPTTMQRQARKWRPYRSVATWYLWRSLDPENAAPFQESTKNV